MFLLSSSLLLTIALSEATFAYGLPSNSTSGVINYADTPATGNLKDLPAATSDTNAPSGNGRKITVINNCKQDINIEFVPGAVAGKNCPDCPAGSTCDSTNGICYHNVPTNAKGYTLTAGGGSTDLTFQDYGYANNLIVSGNLHACFGPSCDPIKKIPTGPSTRAEFTLQRTGKDFYDITVIDGFNFPLEMKPGNAIPSSADSIDKTDPFFCGSPGSITPTNKLLGSCGWSVNATQQYYNAVAGPGTKVCKTNADCAGPGDICGLDINKSQGTELNCGKQVGFWSGKKQCQVEGTCTDPMPAPNTPGQTLDTLYMCDKGIPSCYQDKLATPGCCGCVNWDEAGLTVPASAKKCVYENPNWKALVLPNLKWMKEMCPTAYTYPYDDMSSTFTCYSESGSLPNTVSYTVTFCPQNISVF